MIKRNFSLEFIAFLQASGLLAYCSLVAVILWNGNRWFGNVTGYFAPLLALVLFTTSALISALLTLGYPALLLWEKKQPIQALKLVAYTAGWLVLSTLLVILILIIY